MAWYEKAMTQRWKENVECFFLISEAVCEMVWYKGKPGLFLIGEAQGNLLIQGYINYRDDVPL
jgi:hypothetical protein